MSEPLSPFLDESRWIDSNEHAFAIFDGFPVSPGHTLIIPRRLVMSVFDLDAEGLASLWALVRSRKTRLEYAGADGFNIGVNDGKAAGQTVAHAHVHLIPRYRGDHPNPRGGVRAVIPGKADY